MKNKYHENPLSRSSQWKMGHRVTTDESLWTGRRTPPRPGCLGPRGVSREKSLLLTKKKGTACPLGTLQQRDPTGL